MKTELLRKYRASGGGWMVLALALFSNGAAAATLADLAEGDLVITEIMADPTQVYDYKGEWFEIYNDSGLDVDVNGLVISDMGTDSYTITTSVTLLAGATGLFAVQATSSINGGLPAIDAKYLYANNHFDFGSDELVISYGGVTFDSVKWTKTSLPSMAAYSLSLDPDHWDATLNDNTAYWCYATSMYNSLDYGTPDATNDSCGIMTYTAEDLVAGDLVITEVMVNPTKVSDSFGEWVEVYNNTDGDVNLNGLMLTDDAADTITLTSDVWLYLGGRVLLAPNGNSAKNGGLPTPDYVYSRLTFKLFDTKDEVYLVNSGGTIDMFQWTTAFVSAGPGMSLTLDPTMTDATANDDLANWCYGSTAYGLGDFGTPRDDNDSCP